MMLIVIYGAESKAVPTAGMRSRSRSRWSRQILVGAGAGAAETV